MARRSTALLLRLWIPPLLAVAALLGPGSARAGDPAPDPAASAAPAPDAAPVAPAKAAPKVRVAAVPVREPTVAPATSTPRPVTSAPTVVRSQPKPIARPRVQKHIARAKPAAGHPDVKVIDVPPLRVDVHRGLGAVTRSLRDDSLLLLAGIALLVATFTAASGTTVALIATRTSRREL